MAYADHLRRNFHALRNGTYLNTASYGLLPEAATVAMQRQLTREFEEGRRREDYDAALASIHAQVRSLLGPLLGVNPDTVTLTHSATHGLNIALWGWPLRAGDEVLVTDAEHPAVYAVLSQLRRQKGVTVRVLQVEGPDDVLLERANALMRDRTKLVVASHVTWRTGRRLPVERLTVLAHQRDAVILVDGAQGAGVDPLDLTASGVDMYTFSGHKWLCGPDGTGALYVRPELWTVLDPVFVGTAGLRSGGDWTVDGYVLPAADGRRYEMDRTQLCAWAGLAASLQFLRGQAGWEYIFTRSRTLSGMLMDALLDRDVVELVTPRDARAGMVSFRLPAPLLRAVEEMTQARSVDVRVFTEQRIVRVSTAFYNSEDEIQRLVEIVDRVTGRSHPSVVSIDGPAQEASS